MKETNVKIPSQNAGVANAQFPLNAKKTQFTNLHLLLYKMHFQKIKNSIKNDTNDKMADFIKIAS